MHFKICLNINFCLKCRFLIWSYYWNFLEWGHVLKSRCRKVLEKVCYSCSNIQFDLNLLKILKSTEISAQTRAESIKKEEKWLLGAAVCVPGLTPSPVSTSLSSAGLRRWCFTSTLSSRQVWLKYDWGCLMLSE